MLQVRLTLIFSVSGWRLILLHRFRIIFLIFCMDFGLTELFKESAIYYFRLKIKFEQTRVYTSSDFLQQRWNWFCRYDCKLFFHNFFSYFSFRIGFSFSYFRLEWLTDKKVGNFNRVEVDEKYFATFELSFESTKSILWDSVLVSCHLYHASEF